MGQGFLGPGANRRVCGVARSFRASPTANPVGDERKGFRCHAVVCSPWPYWRSVQRPFPVAEANAAPSGPSVNGRCRSGMHGRDVRVLQDFLTRAGFRTDRRRPVRPRHRPPGALVGARAARRVDGRVSRPDARALRTTVESSARPAVAPVAPPTGKAVVGDDGLATAPADAPPQVQAIIAAGNEIATQAVQVRRRARQVGGLRLRLLGLAVLRLPRRRDARRWRSTPPAS